MSFRFQSDRNTRDICKALRDAGACVEYWKGFSRQKGIPDLVASHAGKLFLIEVKMPGEKLSDDQISWHAKWQSPVHVVTTAEEARAVVFK